MADTVSTSIVSVQIDEQAKSKLVKGLQDIQAAQKRVALESVSLGKSAGDSAKQIRELQKAERDLQTVLRTLDADFDRQSDSAKEAANSIAFYEEALRRTQQGGADLSGDLASSFGGLRGATQAFGGGAVSPAFDILEGFADIGEFAPRLKVQLEAVGKSGSGIIPTIATLASSALPAAGASFGAMLTALAPIALAGAAVVGVFALISNELDKASKAAAKQAEAQIAANQALNEALGTGTTTGEALQRSVDLATQIEIAANNLADAEAAYQEYLVQRGGNLLQALGDAVGLYGDEEQAIADAVIAAQDNFRNLTAEYDALNGAIQTGEFYANDLERAESDLAETRALAAEEAARQAEAAAQRIAQAEAQIAELRTNRAIQAANAEELAALDSQFARQDEKAKVKAFNAELAAISAEGRAKVAALNQEIAALPNELNAALAEAQAKGNAQLQKLNQDYFSSQIKATQDFATQQGRIASETAKTAKRLAEDIADNLADAARDNDVVAFLRIQSDGQKQLKRNAEDASSEEQKRTEDFLRAQDEQRQAFQARQAEILAGIQEERSRITASFQERRAQLEAQRQQEYANTQEAFAAAKARFQAEEAAKDLAAQRAAQRQAILDNQNNAAFQRQISAIQQRAYGESQVTAAFLTGIARIKAAAMSIGTKSPGSSASSDFYRNSTNTSGGFNRSSASTSSATTINVNTSVGDIATASQVSNAIQASITNLAQAWNKGAAKAQG